MSEKKFYGQNNYGWGLTLNLTGKVPAISKRIFSTLADAQAFADDINDSAIEGLLLSVVDDTDDNNGFYFIKSVKKTNTDPPSVLVKSGNENKILELEGITNDIKSKVSTLISDDNGKSVRQIANEELTKQLIPEEAIESLDSLKEIAEWIQNHPEDASQMNQDISNLKSTLSGFTPDNTVSDAVSKIQTDLTNEISIRKETDNDIKTLIGDMSGIDAENVVDYINDTKKIQSEIIVAGLQNGELGEYKNNDVIQIGTDIHTILENILCKELYPENVVGTKANANASLNDLTLNFDKSGNVEVGTMVSLLNAGTNGTSISTTDTMITGLTYGYSYKDDDTRFSADTSIVKTCSTEINDNTYSITANVNQGFNANGAPTEFTTETGNGNANISETEIGCVIEGENKITISATGASYNYSADAIEEVYYCSNLGKTDASKKHSKITSVENVTDKPTKDKTGVINGKYKYYLFYTTKDFDSNWTSDDIVKSQKVKQGWINIGTTTTVIDNNANSVVISNGENIVFACPSKYKLKTFTDDLGISLIESFKVKNVTVKTGNINSEYDIYHNKISGNAKVSFKNVTIVEK